MGIDNNKIAHVDDKKIPKNILLWIVKVWDLPVITGSSEIYFGNLNKLSLEDCV